MTCRGNEDCCRRYGSATSEPPRSGWKSFREKTRLGNETWKPRKRLTWQQMEEMRDLKAHNPDMWTIAKLGQRFYVSQAAVMKILKSQFVPAESVRERQDAKAQKQKAARRTSVKRKR
jgi:hypothetical protein